MLCLFRSTTVSAINPLTSPYGGSMSYTVLLDNGLLNYGNRPPRDVRRATYRKLEHRMAQRVRAQAGGLYRGWITPEIVGPFKGDPGTSDW
jgi:hypothetical protein